MFQSGTSGTKNRFWEAEPPALECFAHLKTIMVHHELGYDVDADFLRLFVLNARVLQSIVVWVNPKAEKAERQDDRERYRKRFAEGREKLQLDNRASPGAQFRYTTDESRKNYWRIRGVRDLYSVDP